MPHGRWITALNKSAAPKRATLLCLHYAGGNSGCFRPWAAGVAPDVELLAVELPGRGSRLTEPLIDRLESVIERLLTALQHEAPGFDSRPLILFGHSMGGWLAFELARQLGRRNASIPAHLIVSGSQSPSLPRKSPPRSKLPRAELIAELGRIGGTDDVILKNQELFKILEPMLRSDFSIGETYLPLPGARVLCDMTALGGLRDPFVEPDQLSAWSAHTIGKLDVRIFEGGHFFINELQSQVLAAVNAIIGKVTGTGSGSCSEAGACASVAAQ